MIPRFEDLVVDPRGVARYRGARLPCAVGRGGMTSEKREGDGAAPIGAVALERVYFRPDRLQRPKSVLPVTPIRKWDGWSDDGSDRQYNDLVRRPHPFSCEIMSRSDPLYDLVAVMDVNRDPAIPGKGSALFLHVWRRPRFPTAGCIAFPRAVLLAILESWTARSRVIIHG